MLAPMAGGPSTPELAASVSEAGGLGFLASAYLTAEATRDAIRDTRELTARSLGVNVFAPPPAPADARTYAAYVERLRQWTSLRGEELGEPRHDDDDFEKKVELLTADPVAVVSFTFGLPPSSVIERLHAVGSEVWITVTAPAEAEQAASAGADALIVQGGEAGGHRGSFTDHDATTIYGLLALLQLVGAQADVPLVASGGIATGGAVAAVLAAGAGAAQVGTAFMLSPEAGTSEPHRDALCGPAETSLTRAFTGRLARGIRNEFMDEHGPHAPIAYPEIHHLTAPLRRAARERADGSMINLWAGETHELARDATASEIVRQLTDDARAACAVLCNRLRTEVR